MLIRILYSYRYSFLRIKGLKSLTFPTLSNSIQVSTIPVNMQIINIFKLLKYLDIKGFITNVLQPPKKLITKVLLHPKGQVKKT
jgi:hypothetical protein